MKITQKDIIVYVANGGDIDLLTQEEKDIIPSEVLNEVKQKVDTDSLPTRELEDYTSEQSDGLYLTEEGERMTQEGVNKALAVGMYRGCMEDEQIRNAPYDVILKFVANGGDRDYLSLDQIANIPKAFLEVSDKTKELLILYAAGKVSSGQLTHDVFVNYNARKCLLNIAKSKLVAQYNEICEKYGYVDNVPQEIVESFDSKLKEMEAWVESKEEVGLQQLPKEEENKRASVISEIDSLGW